MIIDELKEKYKDSVVPDFVHTWNVCSGVPINEFNEVLEQLRPLLITPIQQKKIELADLICNDNEFEIRGRIIEGLTMDGTDKIEKLMSVINKLERK